MKTPRRSIAVVGSPGERGGAHVNLKSTVDDEEDDRSESTQDRMLDDEEEEERSKLRKATLKDDGMFIVSFALPLCYSNAAWTLMNIISMMFLSKAGKDGELYIAAQGVAMIWMGFCQQMMGVPLSVAVESLAAGAFGAEKRHLAAIWLHLSLLIGTVFALLISVTWFYVGSLLKLCNMIDAGDEQYMDLVNTYGRLSVIGILPDVWFMILSTWYQSDEVLFSSAFAPTVGVAASFFTNWLFIFKLEMGFNGAPLAVVACSWVQLFAFLFWSLVFNKEYNEHVLSNTYRRWSKRRVRVFLWDQLLPQVVSTILDESHNMVISGFVVTLGQLQTAAHSFALNVLMAFFSIPNSLMVATGVRVGNYLGANLPHKARRMSVFAIFCGGGVGTALGGMVYLARHQMTFVVQTEGGGTDSGPDNSVAEVAMQIFPWLAATCAAYSMMGTVMGAFDGMARARTVTAILMSGAWFVSVPLAAFFRFGPDRGGLTGIWFAEAMGYAASVSIGFIILAFTNWIQEAKDAEARNDEEEDEEIDSEEEEEDEEEEVGVQKAKASSYGAMN